MLSVVSDWRQVCHQLAKNPKLVIIKSYFVQNFIPVPYQFLEIPTLNVIFFSFSYLLCFLFIWLFLHFFGNAGVIMLHLYWRCCCSQVRHRWSCAAFHSQRRVKSSPEKRWISPTSGLLHKYVVTVLSISAGRWTAAVDCDLVICSCFAGRIIHTICFLWSWVFWTETGDRPRSAVNLQIMSWPAQCSAMQTVNPELIVV